MIQIRIAVNYIKYWKGILRIKIINSIKSIFKQTISKTTPSNRYICYF